MESQERSKTITPSKPQAASAAKSAVIAWFCIAIAWLAGFHLYNQSADEALRIIVWMSLPLLGLLAVTRMRFIETQRTRKIVQTTLAIPLGMFALFSAGALLNPATERSILETRQLANGATLVKIETRFLGDATVRDSSTTDLEYRYPVLPHLIYWSHSVEIDRFPS